MQERLSIDTHSKMMDGFLYDDKSQSFVKFTRFGDAVCYS
jgi:hypothetical protein